MARRRGLCYNTPMNTRITEFRENRTAGAIGFNMLLAAFSLFLNGFGGAKDWWPRRHTGSDAFAADVAEAASVSMPHAFSVSNICSECVAKSAKVNSGIYALI